MCKCLAILGFLLLANVGAIAGELQTPISDTQAVTQVLQAYEDAWSRHDAHSIAAFYNEPAMRVSPDGPTVRADRGMQEAFFRGILAHLLEQGYERSSWEHLEVHLLDSQTAIASGVVVRRRSDGGEFQRQAVTYGLWRTGEGWKIFLSATHEPSTELRFR